MSKPPKSISHQITPPMPGPSDPKTLSDIHLPGTVNAKEEPVKVEEADDGISLFMTDMKKKKNKKKVSKHSPKGNPRRTKPSIKQLSQPLPQNARTKRLEQDNSKSTEQAQTKIASRENTERAELRARQRQMAYLKKRREQKRLHHLYSRLLWVARVLVVGLVCGAIYLLATAPYLIYDAPRFEVRQARLMADQDISHLLEYYVGQPLYSVDPKEITSRLKRHYDIIEGVVVRRHLFPSRIELTILEKQPWAEVYSDQIPPATLRVSDKKVEASQNDSSQNAENKTEPKALPYGIMSNNFELTVLPTYTNWQNKFPDPNLVKLLLPQNNQLNNDEWQSLRKISYYLNTIDSLHLNHIDLSNPELVVARFDEFNLFIGRLDATIEKRLSRLESVVPKALEMKEEIDGVDLRWINQVTFHKRK